ncbi:GrpB family protein [Hyphobacterium sp.]|uniref:GrpB family protein n=1 Tax=Hyphobacterium sp. TaxID=2004662 RepID=UPI003BAB6B1E
MSVTRLVVHDPAWAEVYAREAKALKAMFGAALTDIDHIGSTAIPGILAKPVIDILGSANDLSKIDARNAEMLALGYEPKGEHGLAGRRYFRKADARGRRRVHLHIYRKGDAALHRHLVFRDFLIAHPDKAKAYSELKRELTQTLGLSGQAYQSAKQDWIDRTLQAALDWAARQ